MTEFQASLGSNQLTKLDRVITARRRLATHYDQLLAGTSVNSRMVPPESSPVYQSYVVLLPELQPRSRAELIEWMKEQNVETNIGTWHMPLTTYFRTHYSYRPGDFPITDDIFNRSLTLPLYESLLVIASGACCSGASRVGESRRKLNMPHSSHGSGLFERSQFARLAYNVIFETGVLVFHPENIEIGDDVYIGHYTILKGYFRNKMIIGSGTWIG